MKPLTNNHPYIYQNYQVGIFRSFFCLRLSARKVNSIGRLFTNNTKPLFPARISLCKLAPAPFTLRSSLLCRSCWSQTSGRTDGRTDGLHWKRATPVPSLSKRRLSRAVVAVVSLRLRLPRTRVPPSVRPASRCRSKTLKSPASSALRPRKPRFICGFRPQERALVISSSQTRPRLFSSPRWSRISKPGNQFEN